ncbi:serine hydrolase [Pseudodonghicola xiamenensis]|uniref:Beta-lactamase-related domain-containing protein n=1 Tax=Pseudodonghicola xiamenensis TaxID=337702 RepID=A0A8J3H4K5_9RHOB|nr:serine hydrolase [Pseudodonghicola xiamenensis]GHG79971.1 hypothetical protein GCM10010961_02580 [Pseudodonghicola xiamenensis]
MYFQRFGAPVALILGLSLTAARADVTLPPLALPDPMPAPPQTILLPVPDSRIDAAIATLDDLGQQILERSGVPGLAIAVVHHGQTVYARGFGLRAVDQPEPVDADTVFLLASLSKSVGATVVAAEVGAGTVRWDSPVHDFLPWFDLGDPWIDDHVTIGDLYAHRSGLPDHAGDDLEDIGYDRRAIFDRLAILPRYPFRAHYAYTNFGLTAGAEAVAVAAGTDWASLSEQAIYTPLGMGSTSSRHADYMARPNRAASHVRDGDHFTVSDQRQPDAQSPAGGVSSSVNDMARWMAMVLATGKVGDRQLIAADALIPAISPQAIDGLPISPDARPSLYGYGFGVGTRPSGRVVISHSGAFALGASTTYMLIPDLDLGIVVLSNALPTGAPEAIAASFADRAELGVDSRDWFAGYAPRMAALSAPVGSLVGVSPPANPVPARPDATYIAEYASPYFGTALVEASDQGLILRLGPDGRVLPMTHWDGDSFVVYPVTENQPAGSISRVDFQSEDDDRPFLMTVEHLNENGLGQFKTHK